MNSYRGFRRPERVTEMANTIQHYSQRGPLVITTPIKIDQVSSLVDKSSQKEGGQGAFFYIKDTNERLAIKIFKAEKAEPTERVRRARNIESALKTLSTLQTTLQAGDPTVFLLFNLLNIPKQYIADSDGGLMGLLIPTAPSSCYLDAEIMGRRSKKPVRIGDIISDERHIIPRQTSDSNDPLLPTAKWSFLDSLCQAVASLHELGLIHADISSNNILVRWSDSKDPKAYVIDAFNGFSTTGGNKALGRMRSDVFCPRSLQLGEYTAATDVYCLTWWIVHIAITANPIGAKLPPPSTRDIVEGNDNLYLRHKYVTEGLELGRNTIPSWLYSILEESLRLEPADRPSARDLTYAVHDHWLNYGDSR